MTSRMVGSVLTLVILLFSAVGAAAQTYTQIQWGMNKGVTPYTFGANLNGTWWNLGTLSPSGEWNLIPAGVRVNSGGNTANAGGAVQFGNGTFPSFSPMSQVKGLLSSAVGSELQGGIGFFTRATGSAGQPLLERARINADGTTTFNYGVTIPFTPSGAGAVTTTVDAKLRQTVSVIDFGADPTGVADSAPAFRSACASNRNVIAPPGTYRFASTVTPPGNLGNPTAILCQNVSNFKLSGYGATIVVDNSIAYSVAMFFYRDVNFEVEGFTIQGSRFGMTSVQQNVGIAVVNDVDFNIHDISFPSGFEGLGSPVAGDWLVNGVFKRFYMKDVGQCFDVAYLQNVVFSENTGVGANDTLTGPGNKCFSLVTDFVNVSNNLTGYSFNESNNVIYENNKASNFNAGGFIFTGKRLKFSKNEWISNPGTSPGVSGYGLLIGYTLDPAYSSENFPPQDIVVSGDSFVSNGANVAGCGLRIAPDSIVNSDMIKNIEIFNAHFLDNNNKGICTTSTAKASNIFAWGNTYEGALQTTSIDTNTLSLFPEMPFPQVKGDLRVYNGGNTADAGGAVQFGIGTFPSYSPMSQIKGLLSTSAGTEFQGGIGFYTRPVGAAPQTLTERMRIAADGSTTFVNTATFNSGVVSAGTNPTATGAGGTCAAGTVTGGALVGTVALTGNCVSTNTLALTGMPAATTGYVCDATDRTAKAVTLVETTTTTTSATFEFTASSNSGNVIQFKCLGY